MKRLVVVGCALVTAGFTVVRDSDSLEPIRWPSNTITMVAHDGMTAAENTATQNSLAAWSSVGCSDFTFQYGGTSGTAGDAQDGTNRIGFLTSTWPVGSGVVALTTRFRTAGAPDTWNEADIILNAANHEWATDGRANAYDVQTTVTHELGHVLGLMHTPSPEATMYFGGRPAHTMWRTLHADDIAGLCYLVPAGTFSCSSDDDCPLFDNFYGGDYQRTRCSGGACVTGSSGVYGDACFDGGNCQSGTCLEGLDGAPGIDPGFCTESCGSCPDGDLCDGGVCHLGYDDCVAHADCAGMTNSFCVMDLDGRFRCRRLCDATHPCPGSFTCHLSEDPQGFCRLPGALGDGAPCEHGLECASLVCAGLGVQPVCVGGVASQDGGPPQDGAPPHDGARPQDGASPHDGSPPPDGAPAHDGSPFGGDPPAVAGDGAITGGCSCAAWGQPLWLVIAFMLRRSRRYCG